MYSPIPSPNKTTTLHAFSLSIFLIILFLDIGFLSFKYFDYGRQELARLSLQAQGMAKIAGENPNFERDILQGKGLPIPMGMRRGGMQSSL